MLTGKQAPQDRNTPGMGRRTIYVLLVLMLGIGAYGYYLLHRPKADLCPAATPNCDPAHPPGPSHGTGP